MLKAQCPSAPALVATNGILMRKSTFKTCFHGQMFDPNMTGNYCICIMFELKPVFDPILRATFLWNNSLGSCLFRIKAHKGVHSSYKLLHFTPINVSIISPGKYEWRTNEHLKQNNFASWLSGTVHILLVRPTWPRMPLWMVWHLSHPDASWRSLVNYWFKYKGSKCSKWFNQMYSKQQHMRN